MTNDGNESVLSALLPQEVSALLADDALAGMFSGADLPEDSPVAAAVSAAQVAADKIAEAKAARRMVRRSEMHNLETAPGRLAWAARITQIADLALAGDGQAVVLERLQLTQGYSGYVEWNEFEEVGDGKEKQQK